MRSLKKNKQKLWYSTYVEYCINNGIYNMIEVELSDTELDYDANITRAETVTVINRLIGRVFNEKAEDASKFSDVEGHWAKGFQCKNLPPKANQLAKKQCLCYV